MNALSEAELRVLDWIALHLHTGWLDFLFPRITQLGNAGLIWILVALFLLLCGRRERPYGIQVILALCFSVILCNLILKNMVDRVRPFMLNPMVELLIPAPSDPSFPSGHSSASFAAATVLLLNRHRGRYAALSLAVLIAFSRLYLYVHFPSDVLVGVMTGILSGFLAVLVWNKLLKPRIPWDSPENRDVNCTT